MGGDGALVTLASYFQMVRWVLLALVWVPPPLCSHPSFFVATKADVQLASAQLVRFQFNAIASTLFGLHALPRPRAADLHGIASSRAVRPLGRVAASPPMRRRARREHERGYGLHIGKGIRGRG